MKRDEQDQEFISTLRKIPTDKYPLVLRTLQVFGAHRGDPRNDVFAKRIEAELPMTLDALEVIIGQVFA